jgi:hypothetical protein
MRRAVLAAGDRLELFAALRRATSSPYLSPDDARELLGEYRRLGKERLALGPRELLMPLRQALTGHEHGPELHYVLAALEAGETLARLAAATHDGPPRAVGAAATDSGAAATDPGDAATDPAGDGATAATPPPVTTEGDPR